MRAGFVCFCRVDACTLRYYFPSWTARIYQSLLQSGTSTVGESDYRKQVSACESTAFRSACTLCRLTDTQDHHDSKQDEPTGTQPGDDGMKRREKIIVVCASHLESVSYDSGPKPSGRSLLRSQGQGELERKALEDAQGLRHGCHG